MSRKDRQALSTFYILLVMAIAITLIFLAWVDADAAGGTQVYLPMVGKAESSFQVVNATCGYIYVDAVNFIELDTGYYAGAYTVRRYPSLPMETGTLHHWYTDGNIEHYYGAYPFELGVLYYINAWVKIEGGGIAWVSNGDQLWMPCKPHVEE